MTMTLVLSEEQERVLREAAAQQQTSPEDVVMKVVTQMVKQEKPPISFEEIVEGILRDNAELYQRLA